jgi:hypothetical protein
MFQAGQMWNPGLRAISPGVGPDNVGRRAIWLVRFDRIRTTVQIALICDQTIGFQSCGQFASGIDVSRFPQRPEERIGGWC